MFDLVGPLEVLLPFLGAAAGLGAVGLGTRQAVRALSVDGRAARVRRQQLAQLRQLTGLRIAEDTGSLHGRMGGWMIEIHHVAASRSGLDAGAAPWQIRLLDGARPDAQAEPPAPPTGLAVVRREGTALVAMLPEASHVPAQLQWMTELAAVQHTRPRLAGPTDQALELASTQLGLHWDASLHHWTGTHAGRSLLLDRVHDQDQVQLHLGTVVTLPEGLWIGSEAFAPATGTPLSFARSASLSKLTAIASTAGRDIAAELLDDRALVAELERCLDDARGSRVAGNAVVLCRPTSLFSAAPRTVLEQALALAQRLELAVERPWLTFARTHGLTPSTERAGGRPVLSGSRKGFRVEIRCRLDPTGMIIVAIPDTVELASGLHIQAGPGGGRRTGNLILDQQLTIEAPPEVPDHLLATLPAEALMPLLVAHPTSRIHSDRIQVDLTGTLDIRTLEHAIEDLDVLLQALPRVAAATSS